MTKPLPLRDTRPLDPADRRGVFTVHVRECTATTLCGRATHVASGAVSYFDSTEELAAFVRRLLSHRD